MMENLTELVERAAGKDMDAEILRTFFTNLNVDLPDLYGHFQPSDQFRSLIEKDPYEATIQYWREIDYRAEYMRGSSHRLLRYYLIKTVEYFEDPLASAPFLRSAIEVAAKAIGYQWALLTAWHMCRTFAPFPTGRLVTSQEIESLLLSYSHTDQVDIRPLAVAYAKRWELADTIDRYESMPREKTPTIAKLFAICGFLSKRDGAIIKYSYRFTCDVVHAGLVGLAVSDALLGREIGVEDSDLDFPSVFHSMYSRLVISAHPDLCLNAIKSIAVLFSRHMPRAVDDPFSGLMSTLASPGEFSGVAMIEMPHIIKFLDGDRPLSVEADSGTIRIYK